MMRVKLLKKNFKPQSSKDPEWRRLLPVIVKLQNNGLNDMTPKNPFDTSEALESLKSVLLQEDLRYRLFPDLTKKQVQSELNKLTIEGPPRLPELYSICASHMIDMLYKHGIWTADVIASEIEKRLHQTHMKEFLAENPDIYPKGLNVENEYTVVVRRSKEK